MKKLLLLLMAAVMLHGLTNAQADSSKVSADRKDEWKAKMEEYQAKLDLTADQQEKFNSINEAYRKRLSEIRNSGGGKMSKLKQFKKANKEKDRQMKELLNEQQFEIYREQQELLRQEVKTREKYKM